MDNFFNNMSLSDFQQFANMIAETVSKNLMSQLDDVYINVAGSIVLSLVAAIGILYKSQRSDSAKLTNAYEKMHAMTVEKNKKINAENKKIRKEIKKIKKETNDKNPDFIDESEEGDVDDES